MSGVAGDGGVVFYAVLFVLALLVSIGAGFVGRALCWTARRGWEHRHRPDPEVERTARIELCLTRLESSGADVSQLLGEWLPDEHRG